MALYTDVYNAGQAYGDAGTYVSAANVSGCEKCHGTPYMKHGYRAAEVGGLPDFAACKVCHYDTRNGGHQSWQLLVDNPARYAELHDLAKAAAAAGDTTHDSVEDNMTTDEKTIQYKYTANVMNDVHMSHAMEFPYPQSMSNCVTCHEGKLDMIFTDANFRIETCKSCHPVTGGTDVQDGVDSQGRPVFTVDTRASAPVDRNKQAPSLVGLLPLASLIPQHNPPFATTCNLCHKDPALGGFATRFNEIHTGYDNKIYADAAGTKYSDAFKVSIDSASFADSLLTFAISAAESPDVPGLAVDNIVPTVLVGLYGWDTKDYIVGPHESHADGKRNLETALNAAHPRITGVSAGGGGWQVTADLSTWADKIANGTVKRVEIAVLPALKDAGGVTVALNAPSRTFDLAANAFVNNYFQGTKAIVKVEDGCNKCHEALATTFHSGNRGGNIVVCRLCHTPKSGGSHLEMQSRSIDSYVHAIHSFQAFDVGDVDFTDRVEAARYDLHVEHTYPNFTIKNCASCHNAGTFNAPDQSKSLPGVLSAADNTTANGWDRNIGAVESYVTGPATRACGACHRAKAIKEDNPAELEAFFSHTRTNGYLVEYVDSAGTETVINTIMANFYDVIVLSQP
jgi:OmcA/MtrC family decaheme c-type cytochrome